VPERSRSTILVWALAALLAVVAGSRLLGGHEPPPPAPVKLAAERGHAESRIYVHVTGAVRRARLMTLPAGSRVADAVRLAGGPSPHADLTAVNLAARLADGQQIVVPASGAGPGAAGGLAEPGAGGAQVHLSTATVAELDGVDGIGPTLAQRIIEYRDEHGGLRSLAELAQVDGIGEKRLATLRDALQP
jgi:competence protein ComEA